MISFVIKGGLEASRKFLSTCKIFTLAESLGGVESLIEHPGDHDACERAERDPRASSASSTASSGCRSESRTSPICRPISKRRSPPRNSVTVRAWHLNIELTLEAPPARPGRLHRRPRAAGDRQADGRPVRVPRSHGPGEHRRDGRAAAPAHQPRDRDVPVPRRDPASRLPRHQAVDHARRDQLDERRARHRALRTDREGRRRSTRCTASSCGSRCRRRSRTPSRTFDHHPAATLPELAEADRDDPRARRHRVRRDVAGDDVSPMFYAEIAIAARRDDRDARRATPSAPRTSSKVRVRSVRQRLDARHMAVFAKGASPVTLDRRRSDARSSCSAVSRSMGRATSGGTSCRARPRRSTKPPRSGAPALGRRCSTTRSSSRPRPTVRRSSQEKRHESH